MKLPFHMLHLAKKHQLLYPLMLMLRMRVKVSADDILNYFSFLFFFPENANCLLCMKGESLFGDNLLGKKNQKKKNHNHLLNMPNEALVMSSHFYWKIKNINLELSIYIMLTMICINQTVRVLTSVYPTLSQPIRWCSPSTPPRFT